MERDNISEFQYREPHPIFYVQQHHRAVADALRAELDAERERRVAAEQRAVLTAGERRELTKVRQLRHDLNGSIGLNVYQFAMFLLAIAILKGWV